jgi:hypothetical protein
MALLRTARARERKQRRGARARSQTGQEAHHAG